LVWKVQQEKKKAGIVLTVEDRKSYIYMNVIKRIYNTGANNIMPPECVVNAVLDLPSNVSWRMDDRKHHDCGDMDCDLTLE
jgi:hypothetical protein